MQTIDAHHHLWDIENHNYPHMKGPEPTLGGPTCASWRSFRVSQ